MSSLVPVATVQEKSSVVTGVVYHPSAGGWSHFSFEMSNHTLQHMRKKKQEVIKYLLFFSLFVFFFQATAECVHVDRFHAIKQKPELWASELRGEFHFLKCIFYFSANLYITHAHFPDVRADQIHAYESGYQCVSVISHKNMDDVVIVGLGLLLGD